MSQNALAMEETSDLTNVLAMEETSELTNVLAMEETSDLTNVLPIEETTDVTNVLAMEETSDVTNVLPIEETSDVTNLPLNLSIVDPNTPRNFSIKIASYTFKFNDLLSLETRLSQADLLQIKTIYPSYRPGWLHDKIINSYLHVLTHNTSSIMYCGSSESLVILDGKCFDRLWPEEDLFQCNNVFVVYNRGGCHWVLLYYRY